MIFVELKQGENRLGTYAGANKSGQKSRGVNTENCDLGVRRARTLSWDRLDDFWIISRRRLSRFSNLLKKRKFQKESTGKGHGNARTWLYLHQAVNVIETFLGELIFLGTNLPYLLMRLDETPPWPGVPLVVP